MTTFEFTILSIALLSIVWVATIAIYANHRINQYKEQVEYYQHPQTQCDIARHVLKNRWYVDSGEVFR